MREACFLNGLTYLDRYSIIEKDSFPYGDSDRLAEKLREMPSLPDCFVAANDSIAVSLIEALKKLNRNIPEDVSVIGFDNILDSKNSNPPLTTFSVDKALFGKKILSVLLDRISEPIQRSQFVYLQSKVIVRKSTKL